MRTIQIDGVSFHYDHPYVQVFDDITLSIDPTWRTALVGLNGRGKTTLLRLIAGQEQPVRGSVSTPMAVSLFPYEVQEPYRPTLDIVRDCVAPFRAWEYEMEWLLDNGGERGLLRYGDLLERYEKEGGYDIDARIEQECVRLGMDVAVLAQPFVHLSGGQQTRALIMAMFLKRNSYPLIDEPTNHLDMEGRALLGEYLAQQNGFLLVSHDRDLLDRCADHIVAINRRDIHVMQGAYTQWRERMRLEEEHERRRSDNLRREIRSLEEAAQKRRTWSHAREREKRGAYDKGFVGHRAAKQMKRALAVERRIDEHLAEKRQLLGNAELQRRLHMGTRIDAPDVVLTVDAVGVDIDGRTIVDGVSFRVRKGERVALLGPNGCGKTTLLRLVCGDLQPTRGTVWLPPRLHTARAYQTPLWAAGLLRDHLHTAGIDGTAFRTLMGSFGITGDIFERPIETFSFGQRRKVDLCRSFLQPAHLVVWDEPMNYIDLLAREQIEEALAEAQPTMLFTEHDRAFVEHIATDIIEL